MSDTLRTIPSKLADLEPVRGNSMSASFEGDGLYWVRSYATAIAVYDPSDRTLYLNATTYGVTTSRHQGTLYALTSLARSVVEVNGCGMGSSAWRTLRNAVETYAPVSA